MVSIAIVGILYSEITCKYIATIVIIVIVDARLILIDRSMGQSIIHSYTTT
jgi:hypothetical protein